MSRRHLHGARCQPWLPSRSLGLPDVVCEAPSLLQYLPKASYAALSSCSRQFRVVIRSSTAVITLDKVVHIKSIAKRDWPQLSLVVLQSNSLYWRPDLLNVQHDLGDQLQLQAILYCHVDINKTSLISHNDAWTQACILVRQQPMSQTPQHACDAQHLSTAFRHLQQPQFQGLQRLTLSHSRLDADSIAQLTIPDWQSLSQLDISGNQLSMDAYSALAKGKWPRLRHLDVSMCDLDKDAMAQLACGIWPQLATLDISANPSLAADMSSLVQARWNELKLLRMRDMGLSADALVCVLERWQTLTCIDLGWTLESPIPAKVGREPWMTHITFLDLTGNDLDAKDMSVLVSATMIHLESLHLSQNCLNAEAARHLAQSTWPKLSCLDLSDNLIDNAAVKSLRGAVWPLKRLNLRTNPFEACALKHVRYACWDDLSSLKLDGKLGCEQTWEIFGLDPSALPGFAAQMRRRRRVKVQRLAKFCEIQGSLCFLVCVKFYRAPTVFTEIGQTGVAERPTHLYHPDDSSNCKRCLKKLLDGYYT